MVDAIDFNNYKTIYKCKKKKKKKKKRWVGRYGAQYKGFV
jgi:hypothetical protein